MDIYVTPTRDAVVVPGNAWEGMYFLCSGCHGMFVSCSWSLKVTFLFPLSVAEGREVTDSLFGFNDRDRDVIFTIKAVTPLTPKFY